MKYLGTYLIAVLSSSSTGETLVDRAGWYSGQVSQSHTVLSSNTRTKSNESRSFFNNLYSKF